ncbi:DUF1686 domain-containing protein [Encephalitozoon intestinalis]|nr:DUF1686 domain-containing protein [Encephalitozoon intestinalis]
MDQIKSIEVVLRDLEKALCKIQSFKVESSILSYRYCTEMVNVIGSDRMFFCSLVETEILQNLIKYLSKTNTKKSDDKNACISVVQGAIEELNILKSFIQEKQKVLECSSLNPSKERFGEKFFKCFDDLRETYPRLLQSLKNLFKKLLSLPDTKKYFEENPINRNRIKEFLYGSPDYQKQGTPQYTDFMNLLLKSIQDFSSCVVEECFSAINKISLDKIKKEVSDHLWALRKEAERVSASQISKVERILDDAENAFESLLEELNSFSLEYASILDGFKTEKGLSLSKSLDKLKSLCGEAIRTKLNSLKEKLGNLEQALAEVQKKDKESQVVFVEENLLDSIKEELSKKKDDPLISYSLSFLHILFIAILLIYVILSSLEKEDSKGSMVWNTAVYFASILGTTIYMTCILLRSYRNGGIPEMIKQWTAVGCMVPMALGLAQTGIVRNGLHSLIMAAISVMMVYIQCFGVRMGPLQMAVLCGGNLLVPSMYLAGKMYLLYPWCPEHCACIGFLGVVGMIIVVSGKEKNGGNRGIGMDILLGATIIMGSVVSWMALQKYSVGSEDRKLERRSEYKTRPLI